MTPLGAGASTAKLLSYWEQPSFAIGDVEFLAIDVALAAMARGDWSPFERRLAEGLACAAHARNRRHAPTAETLDAAGTAFRYDRELISAAEMNNWLVQSRISLDEWTQYLTRDLLRGELRETIDNVLDDFQPSAGALLEASFAEGVCSGWFETLEDRFAGRVAFTGDLVGTLSPATDSASASDAARQLVHANAHWLAMRPADETAARACRVLAIEAAYDLEVARLLAAAPLADIVDRYRMDWRLIDTDTVVFPTEHAAREAILCVTDEQLSLQHVASLARRSAVRQSRFADAIDAADRVLSADPGSVVGPTLVDGGFAVTHLAGRTWPSLDDPRIAARARAEAIDTAVREAMRERIRRRAAD